MLAATGAYGWSYLARRRGHHRVGAAVAVAAGALATFGDYFGGYLTLGRQVGVAVTTDQRQGAGRLAGGNPLYSAAVAVSEHERLDTVTRPTHRAAAVLFRPGPVKNVLTGYWLGHSLHPLLTDFPLGAWMSATALDLFGGRRAQQASERLVAFGLLAAVPTAAAGMCEWVDTQPREQRVGILHAALNGTGWSLYAVSFTARRRGRHTLAVALGIAGGVVATCSRYFGDHLSLVRGVGVSSASDATIPPDWTRMARTEELGSEALRAVVGDEHVLVVSDGAALRAVVARCTHRGGPLHGGGLDEDCVACPWHGSRSRLLDGAVVRGPAAVPAVRVDARQRDGWLEVRRQSSLAT